jgi:hypothetical protein
MLRCVCDRFLPVAVKGNERLGVQVKTSRGRVLRRNGDNELRRNGLPTTLEVLRWEPTSLATRKYSLVL